MNSKRESLRLRNQMLENGRWSFENHGNFRNFKKIRKFKKKKKSLKIKKKSGCMNYFIEKM